MVYTSRIPHHLFLTMKVASQRQYQCIHNPLWVVTLNLKVERLILLDEIGLKAQQNHENACTRSVRAADEPTALTTALSFSGP